MNEWISPVARYALQARMVAALTKPAWASLTDRRAREAAYDRADIPREEWTDEDDREATRVALIRRVDIVSNAERHFSVAYG